MQRVVGTDQKIRTALRELVRGAQHQFSDANPVAAIDALHVVGERVGMHRDLGVSVRPEKLRALHADGAITQSRTLSGAGDNADVARHDLKCTNTDLIRNPYSGGSAGSAVGNVSVTGSPDR